MKLCFKLIFMFCLLNFLFANPLNLGEENTFVGLDIRKRDRFV